MDSATKVQIAGLVYTVVLPVGAAVAVLLVGRKLRPASEQPLLVGLALIAGLVAAHAGIGGAPTLSLAGVDGWLLYGPLAAGLVGLALDRFAPGRAALVAPLALAAVALVTWQISGALAALWAKGAATAPIATAFIVDAAAIGALVWLLVDHTARQVERPAPIVLGALALTLVGAALTIGLSGSARMAQTNGAVAAVVGVVALVGWRWPALRPGHGAVAVAVLALIAALLHGHHFVELPRGVAGLLLVAPLGALVATRLDGRRAIAATAVVTVIAVAAAVIVTISNEAQKARAAESDSSGDGGEGYYPY